MSAGNPCGVAADDTRLDPSTQQDCASLSHPGVTLDAGVRVGRWTILSKSEPLYRRRLPAFLCRCDCGTDRSIPAQTLRRGESQSCGCLKRELSKARNLIDLSGKTFGRLKVVEMAGHDRRPKWHCVCACGAECIVAGESLRGGITQSCGCLWRERVIEANSFKAKDVPLYGAAHARVVKAKGKATSHTCVDCDVQAAEWSYNHTDPNELESTSRDVHCKYSADPAHYSPRCVSCHRKFDRRWSTDVGAEEQ